jgi:hypothetical protein
MHAPPAGIEVKARDSANCPMTGWCLGVLLVEGLEGIPAIDPLIH